MVVIDDLVMCLWPTGKKSEDMPHAVNLIWWLKVFLQIQSMLWLISLEWWTFDTYSRTSQGRLPWWEITPVKRLCFCIFVSQLYCPMGISPIGNSGCFSFGSQQQQSHATQPTVYAGCFSVFIIHQTPTSTTESLTCTHLMHTVVHEGAWIP